MFFPQEHDCPKILVNNNPKKRKEKKEQLTTPSAKCISIFLNEKKNWLPKSTP